MKKKKNYRAVLDWLPDYHNGGLLCRGRILGVFHLFSDGKLKPAKSKPHLMEQHRGNVLLMSVHSFLDAGRSGVLAGQAAIDYKALCDRLSKSFDNAEAMYDEMVYRWNEEQISSRSELRAESKR